MRDLLPLLLLYLRRVVPRPTAAMRLEQGVSGVDIRRVQSCTSLPEVGNGLTPSGPAVWQAVPASASMSLLFGARSCALFSACRCLVEVVFSRSWYRPQIGPGRRFLRH